jgi:uncharacterized protein with FMN-binding domain
MRRIMIVIVATIGGLALLASFHTSPGIAIRSTARGPSALQPPAGGTPPTKGPSASSPNTTAPPSNTAPSNTAPSTSAAAPPSARKTIDGPVVSNDYGPVQVQVVVENGQLLDVEAIQLPSDRRRSAEISSIAGPDLRQEALQARSANINVISGATYTSESYAQSLQAALDQAGL